MGPLPPSARLYVVAVCLLSLPLALMSALIGARQVDVIDFVGLSLLLLVTEMIGSRGPRDMATIALGSVVTAAALPLVGGWGAILLAATTIFAYDGQPLVKRVFNTAQTTVSASASALTFVLLNGREIGPDCFPYLLIPFVAALLVQCVVNGMLVATIVHLAQTVPIRVVLQGTMAGSVLSYVGYGLFGLLLAVLWADGGADVGPAAAILVLLPLYVARWAYEQYAEQQRAYERTVRALIAAVETKDLYTRGHSERVSAGVGTHRAQDRHA